MSTDTTPRPMIPQRPIPPARPGSVYDQAFAAGDRTVRLIGLSGDSIVGTIARLDRRHLWLREQTDGTSWRPRIGAREIAIPLTEIDRIEVRR